MADIEICLRCSKELKDKEKCTCEKSQELGQAIIFGDDISVVGTGIACKCGIKELQFVSHVNMVTKHITTYKCAECGNLIGKEVEVEPWD